jgi:hypothetical protein
MKRTQAQHFKQLHSRIGATFRVAEERGGEG